MTLVKSDNAFKFTPISNISPQILRIFGDFLDKYSTKDMNLRWQNSFGELHHALGLEVGIIFGEVRLLRKVEKSLS